MNATFTIQGQGGITRRGSRTVSADAGSAWAMLPPIVPRFLTCGSPMIVDGQVHGGVVQGWGQTLWEGAVYDDSGQLLTGSMTDYALPRAHMLPQIETLSTVTPSPHNPLGVS